MLSENNAYWFAEQKIEIIVFSQKSVTNELLKCKGVIVGASLPLKTFSR